MAALASRWQQEQRGADGTCLSVTQEQPDQRPRVGLSVVVFALIGVTCFIVLGFGLGLRLLSIGQALTAGALGLGFSAGAWFMRDLAAPGADSVVTIERRGDHLSVVLNTGTTVRLGPVTAIQVGRQEQPRSTLDKDHAVATIRLAEPLQQVTLTNDDRTVVVAQRTVAAEARSLVSALRELLATPTPP